MRALRAKEEWRRFFGALIFLGALAAILLLPTQAYGTWLLVGALVLSLGYVFLPRVLESATRIQNYPRLLEQVVDLREQVDELRSRLRDRDRDFPRALEAGIQEGMRRVYGEFFAFDVGPLALQGIAESDRGVLLVAEYQRSADESSDPPVPMTRLAVVDVHTGSRRGVVEIVSVEPEKRLVFMLCVEATVPDFWEHLERRVAADTSPPANVRLEPATYPLPQAGPGAGLVAARTYEEGIESGD